MEGQKVKFSENWLKKFLKVINFCIWLTWILLVLFRVLHFNKDLLAWDHRLFSWVFADFAIVLKIVLFSCLIYCLLENGIVLFCILFFLIALFLFSLKRHAEGHRSFFNFVPNLIYRCYLAYIFLKKKGKEKLRENSHTQKWVTVHSNLKCPNWALCISTIHCVLIFRFVFGALHTSSVNK